MRVRLLKSLVRSVGIEAIDQSIFVLLQQETTADTAATERFKTRMRSLLSRMKVGMFS